MSAASALSQRAFEASIDRDPAAADLAHEAADAYDAELAAADDAVLYVAELYAESAAAYARGE